MLRSTRRREPAERSSTGTPVASSTSHSLVLPPVGADVEPKPVGRLRRNDPDELLAVGRVDDRSLGRAPQIVVQTHATQPDSARGDTSPGAVRAARPELRPLRAPALLRAGPRLAPVPRLACAARPGGHRARPGHRHRPVALELVRQKGCSVVGVDQSPEMLAEARRRIGTDRVRLVEASAEELPFEDESFDGLTAAYLLRYLSDLPAGLRGLARVLRPGATASLLDFGVPPARPRAPFGISTWTSASPRSAASSRPVARGRRFLGGSIRRVRPALAGASAGGRLRRGRFRRRAGEAPEPRRLLGALGPASVTEARAAFYALAPGGWRDYVTLLHPPYTAWHLSYVAIGAALAPSFTKGGLRPPRWRSSWGWESPRTRSTS